MNKKSTSEIKYQLNDKAMTEVERVARELDMSKDELAKMALSWVLKQRQQMSNRTVVILKDAKSLYEREVEWNFPIPPYKGDLQ